MKVFAIDPTANKFHDIPTEASGQGESTGKLSSGADVLSCGWAQEYAKRQGVERDLLVECEDERYTDQLARMIVDDERVTPWEVEILLMTLRVNDHGRRVASLEERKLIWRDYQLLLSWKAGR